MVQARPQTFEMDATDGDGCWAIPWYEPNACDEPVAHVCAVEACAREVEIVVDSGADISVAPATSAITMRDAQGREIRELGTRVLDIAITAPTARR